MVVFEVDDYQVTATGDTIHLWGTNAKESLVIVFEGTKRKRRFVSSGAPLLYESPDRFPIYLELLRTKSPVWVSYFEEKNYIEIEFGDDAPDEVRFPAVPDEEVEKAKKAIDGGNIEEMKEAIDALK